MDVKTFSVKVNGKTERLIAINKDHAIERAMNLFKCNLSNIGKVKQLKRK